LFQGDIIERVGRMASAAALNSSSAQTELARRVSGRLGLDIAVARQRVGELIGRGVMQLESKGNGLRWQWTDTQNLKLTNAITSIVSCQA
jgi:hypothetical protein